MLDYSFYFTFSDGSTSAEKMISDHATTDIQNALNQLEQGAPASLLVSREAMIERLRIELVARELEGLS